MEQSHFALSSAGSSDSSTRRHLLHPSQATHSVRAKPAVLAMMLAASLAHLEVAGSGQNRFRVAVRSGLRGFMSRIYVKSPGQKDAMCNVICGVWEVYVLSLSASRMTSA